MAPELNNNTTTGPQDPQSSPEAHQKELLFHYNCGYEVLGPVFSAFAQWIYDIAEQQNIRTVFFIMREGELFHRLLENLSDFNNAHTPCRSELLFVSRKSLWTARIESMEDLRTILTPYLGQIAVSRVCDLFGLGVEEVGEVREGEGEVGGEGLKYYADTLTSDNFAAAMSPILSRIISRSRARRINLDQYLQRKFENVKRCIVVNMGYGMSSHYFLSELLPDVEFLGLYLCTYPCNKYRFDISTLQSQGFLVNLDDRPSIINIFWVNNAWIETACMGPKYPRSTIAYDGEGRPVFDEKDFTSEEREFIDEMQRGICDFQSQEEESIKRQLRFSPTKLRDALCNLVTDFCCDPDKIARIIKIQTFFTAKNCVFNTGDPIRDKILASQRVFEPVYYNSPLPLPFLLDVDDTILKEVQIDLFRGHPMTQILRYIPDEEFRARYKHRLEFPSTDPNKVRHYEFTPEKQDREYMNSEYISSVVCIRPSMPELLARLEPYIRQKLIQPYLFSANDDRRTHHILHHLKIVGSRTLHDHGFQMISRNDFLCHPFIHMRKSLITLRKNRGWRSDNPIIVVDDHDIDYDASGNDFVMKINPFGRKEVTDYLLNNGIEFKFDDSSNLDTILQAIESRVSTNDHTHA